MKNIYKLLFLAFSISFNGCEDKDKGPIFIYSELETGTFIRLISNEEGENLIDLNDGIDSFSHTYEVEFVGDETGLVNTLVVDVEYHALGNSDTAVSNNKRIKENFITMTSEDFVLNGNGYQQTPKITFTALQVLDSLGLKKSDLLPKDEFRFKMTITREDGTEYSSSNSSPTVQGSAYRGYFDFTMFMGCKSNLNKIKGTVVKKDTDVQKGQFIAITTVKKCGTKSVPNNLQMFRDTVIITRSNVVAVGEYGFDDWTFGVNKACFGKKVGPQTGFVFTDVCGEVTFTELTDAFGTEWEYTSSVSGDDWTIEWNNGASDGKARLEASTVVTIPGGVPFTVN